MAQRKDNTTEQNKTKVTRESFREALKIFQYIRPYRWYFILGMVLLALSSLVFMSFPYLIGKMINIAEGESNELGLNLNQMGLLLLVILLIQGFVSYFRVIMFANVSERGIADVRKALYQRMISLP
ncbi:MAG: ABC transporter transmembrane domain-containing protein, partial [Bacteroidota bacterium]